MKKIVFICIFSICFVNVLYAGVQTESNNNKFTIKNVTIVNVKTGKLQPNMSVVIEGNSIKEIVNSDKISIKKNMCYINAKGKYLIPGLWDMHTHLVGNQDIAFPSYIINGVTGVRDMGAYSTQVEQWKQRIDKDKVVAPRIVYPGPILDGISGGFHIAVKTEQEAREYVKHLKKKGVNFIKVYSWLPKNIYYAIVDEAKKQKLDVSGHIPISVGATGASKAGQKSIEHLYGMYIATSNDEFEENILQNPPKGEDYADYTDYDLKASEYNNPAKEKVLFELLAKNNTWQVPTLVLNKVCYQIDTDYHTQYVPGIIQAEWIEVAKYLKETQEGQDMMKKSETIMKNGLNMVKRMNDAGVPIMAGTDDNLTVETPIPNYVYGFDLHDELELLCKAGLTPLESLQSATINPAKFLNKSDLLGTVEKGKLADLVLLNENPLDDISNTKKIEAVVENGHLLDKNKLNEMLKTITFSKLKFLKDQNQQNLYPVQSLCKEIDAKVNLDKNTNIVTIQKQNHKLQFKIDYSQYDLDGKLYLMERQSRLINCQIMIPGEIVDVLVKWIGSPMMYNSDNDTW